MPIEVVTGDILKSTETWLVHQTNCTTQKAAGLSKAVFAAFPHADVYTGRTTPAQPGTIALRGEPGPEHPRGVINLFGQFYPGKPRYPESPKDGFAARERYFQQGLEAIARLEYLESLAIPYQIGSGLAGGRWARYLGMLGRFAALHPEATITIYRLTGG